MGVYYRSASQDDATNVLFQMKLMEISRAVTLVLTHDFKFPAVNWDKKWSRKFPEYIEENA